MEEFILVFFECEGDFKFIEELLSNFKELNKNKKSEFILLKGICQLPIDKIVGIYKNRYKKSLENYNKKIIFICTTEKCKNMNLEKKWKEVCNDLNKIEKGLSLKKIELGDKIEEWIVKDLNYLIKNMELVLKAEEEALEKLETAKEKLEHLFLKNDQFYRKNDKYMTKILDTSDISYIYCINKDQIDEELEKIYEK